MGIPWPTSEWDEIVPGLWQGGHVYEVNGAQFTTDMRGRDFDLVVSLYSLPWVEQTVPSNGVEHLVFEIYDDSTYGVLPEDEAMLGDIANQVHHALELGLKVLVRCQAGYNRSGLVVALALLKQGMKPASAIALIREKRSPWALSNKAFEAYVLRQGG